MDALEYELKVLVVEALGLEDIKPEDIDADAPLFGERGSLGLDSIDALELGIALQKKYQIKIDSEDTATRSHFATIKQLALFVTSHRPVKTPPSG